jgi:hypothetical protein
VGFYVFDLDLNWLGTIDDFVNSELLLSYDSLGSLDLTLDGTSEFASLLQVDRIITKSTDLSRGYLIKTREYLDEKSSELQIIAPSLNVLLNDRLVLGQQEFTGSIENVMKSFVLVNAVQPANPNRIIPNLVISENWGIPIETTEGAVNQYLCDYLYELCKKHDVSFDILLDHENKKFVFDVWQGMDRTTNQNVHSPVVFAKEFENVLKQHYTESVRDWKTTAVVLGENAEGQPGMTVTVNDNQVGYDRKEILIESTGIRKAYMDENEVEVVLTDDEYRRLLEEKGKNSLSEYMPIRTLESDVDGEANFIYGQDYFMGDKVSVRNDELGLILHTRIMSVNESVDNQGEKLQLNFGSNIPSFIEKVKRAVKNNGS